MKKGDWVTVNGREARVDEVRDDRLVCWFPDDPQGKKFVWKRDAQPVEETRGRGKMKKVRIRWGFIRDCGPVLPFEGIIVEDLAGNRIQDIPTEHTPAVVHAVVGEPIKISHYVKVHPECSSTQIETLTLLVVANEIPEAKREELKQEWIRFFSGEEEG